MITRKCNVCDTEINCYASTYNKKKYCSSECKKTKTHTEINCINCNELFYIRNCYLKTKSIKQKVCSQKCYDSFKKEKTENAIKNKTYICTQCGVSFISQRNCKTNLVFCSQECSKKYMRGERSPFYSGGSKINGYASTKINGKYYLNHRVIMENHIGRKLKDYEVVHHINYDKTDNRIENLQILNKREHDRLHTTERHKEEKLFGKNKK